MFRILILLLFSSGFWCENAQLERLIKHLKNSQTLKSSKVEEAMRKVDRKLFAPSNPYEDSPQVIYDSQPISAPHMHVYAMEQVAKHFAWDDESEVRVLDIGSGSGILCAYFLEYFNRKAQVIGVEVKEPLVQISTENIDHYDSTLLTAGKIKFVAGDGHLGYRERAPYDVIHIGACCTEEPTELINKQLKPGGVLVAPVCSDFGERMLIVTKDLSGTIHKEYDIDVCYVPLVKL